ncbi:DUF5694 domain-containing protein [Emcibacter sp.]|uniref:DUF5694 domain-containing protein n=1 Tax=Emcibacter sp. TaxID=1979954 RepID=UPI003A8DEE9F
MHKPFLIILGLLVLALPVGAEETTPEPARIMIMGTFHFSNPGRDMVKNKQINVLEAENQAYLEQLAARLAAFKPTHILLEYTADRDGEMNDKLARYLAGKAGLSVNENQQVGFRLAKTAGLDRVYGFDEQTVHWNPELLMKEMPEKAPETQAAFNSFIQQITADFDRFHKTLSLKELLLKMNEPELDRMNKDLYLLTNAVGAGESFSGADAAASWWHRNFRMYANIQKLAEPGARIFVLGGQGHTAILRDLLAIDTRLEAVDVTPYF